MLALRLELLNHSRSDLLTLNNLTLAITVRAIRDVVFIVSSTAATMGTDDLPVVGEFELAASVQFCEGHSDLESDGRARLLLSRVKE